MSIFKFADYRAYLKAQIQAQPKGGRGQMLKLAQVLNVHSTFVSLVFKNKRDLSAEQAILMARHFELTESETEYFLNLVHYARAGNAALTSFYRAKIELAQRASRQMAAKFEHDRKLTSEQRQIFYSSWHYSALRIYTSTDANGRSLEEICAYFKLQRGTVVAALEFLSQARLVIEENGRFKVGARRTFLEKNHPLLKCHHTNWRQKALGQYEELTDNEMMFTSTLSLSNSDFLALREHLAELVKKASDIMKDTQPEEVACLNIDFFIVR